MVVSMNNFTVAFKHDKPLYLELYYEIKNKIDQGIIKADEKLPSKRMLAKNLGVSTNTILTAYELLLDEGYIYSKEKKGYYVSKQTLLTKSEMKVTMVPRQTKQYQYDLTTANNNLLSASSNIFLKSIKETLHQNDFYIKTDLEGSIYLRKNIAKHLYENRGIKVNEQQIVIGTGLEMLEMIFPLLNKDSYALENPGYHKLSYMLSNNHYKIEYVSLDKEGVLIPKHSDILYTTSFNQFPTGVKMTIGRKKELINWVKKNNGYIIEDDFDADFRLSGTPTTSLYMLCPEHVIFFSTFSSTLCSGIRISFAILPEQILSLYLERYKYYTNPVSSLQQQIVNHFIESGAYARHLNRIKNQLNKKRAYIISALKNLTTVTIDTKKNFLSLMMNLKNEQLAKIVKDRLLEHNIKMNAISDYDVTKKPSKTLLIGYTNISFEKLIEAIQILKSIIEKA